jgi:site-specific DNA recombinase
VPSFQVHVIIQLKIQEALKLSHRDEKEYHNNAISKLQAESQKIQSRIDKMYEDRLDGRIDGRFFDTKANEFRQKQKEIARSIERHGSANKNYFRETGILLELASLAHKLFKKQKPEEKRRLLRFVLSNCSWKDDELTANFRQPFDLLRVTPKPKNNVPPSNVQELLKNEEWLGDRDLNPDKQIQSLLSCRWTIPQITAKRQKWI